MCRFCRTRLTNLSKACSILSTRFVCTPPGIMWPTMLCSSSSEYRPGEVPVRTSHMKVISSPQDPLHHFTIGPFTISVHHKTLYNIRAPQDPLQYQGTTRPITISGHHKTHYNISSPQDPLQYQGTTRPITISVHHKTHYNISSPQDPLQHQFTTWPITSLQDPLHQFTRPITISVHHKTHYNISSPQDDQTEKWTVKLFIMLQVIIAMLAWLKLT